MKRLIFVLASAVVLVAGLKLLRRKMDEHDRYLMTDLVEIGMALPEDEGMVMAMNADARPPTHVPPPNNVLVMPRRVK